MVKVCHNLKVWQVGYLVFVLPWTGLKIMDCLWPILIQNSETINSLDVCRNPLEGESVYSSRSVMVWNKSRAREKTVINNEIEPQTPSSNQCNKRSSTVYNETEEATSKRVLLKKENDNSSHNDIWDFCFSCSWGCLIYFADPYFVCLMDLYTTVL